MRVRTGRASQSLKPSRLNFAEDLVSSSIEPHDMERALGQVDTNSDKGGFRGDFRLLWGLDFHSHSGLLFG
jgi:hypothetical protein